MAKTVFSSLLQVTVTITVVRGNFFTPAFTQLMYTASIREFNALLPNGSLDFVLPNSLLPVASFSATDGDGDDLEYFITGGNELGIFDISNPKVSDLLKMSSQLKAIVIFSR